MARLFFLAVPAVAISIQRVFGLEQARATAAFSQTAWTQGRGYAVSRRPPPTATG